MKNLNGEKIRKKAKIIERNLGREKCKAQYILPPHDYIEIHSKLKPKMRFFSCVHEAIHRAFPDLSERKTLIAEKIIAGVLWEDGYRKVSQ